jgi:hypothetical protein
MPIGTIPRRSPTRKGPTTSGPSLALVTPPCGHLQPPCISHDRQDPSPFLGGDARCSRRGVLQSPCCGHRHHCVGTCPQCRGLRLAGPRLPFVQRKLRWPRQAWHHLGPRDEHRRLLPCPAGPGPGFYRYRLPRHHTGVDSILRGMCPPLPSFGIPLEILHVGAPVPWSKRVRAARILSATPGSGPGLSATTQATENLTEVCGLLRGSIVASTHQQSTAKDSISFEAPDAHSDYDPPGLRAGPHRLP